MKNYNEAKKELLLIEQKLTSQKKTEKVKRD